MEQEYLKSILDYDEDTGLFRWKAGARRVRKAGAIAGNFTNRYVRISINKKWYPAHRLAWLYVHGEYLTEPFDHVDRDKHNNRISNIRKASHAENMQNRDFKGYSFCNTKNRWRANISANGTSHHLGYYRTEEEASAAYVAAKKVLHPSFTHPALC